MAKVSGAQSNIGGVEERLRRALALAGLIEADFEASLRPIVIADDATRPGCNVVRGRYFAFTQEIGATAAADVTRAIKAVNPVILDRIMISCSEDAIPATAAYIRIWGMIQAKDIADFAAIATQNTGAFTESIISASDRPPLLQSADSGVAFGTAATVLRTDLIVNVQPVIIPISMHLNTGDKFALVVRPRVGAALTNVNVTYWGRVF